MNKAKKKLAYYMSVVTALTVSLLIATSDDNNQVAQAEGYSATDLSFETKSVTDFSINPENILVAHGTAPKETIKNYDPNDRTNETEDFKDVPQYHTIDSEYLNVRQKPNAKSKIKDVLVKGWVVEVEKITDEGWLLIKGGGYVNGKYTEFTTSDKALKQMKKQSSQPKPEPTFKQPVKKAVKKVSKETPHKATAVASVQKASTKKAQVTQASDRKTDNNINTSKNEAHPAGGFSAQELDLLARLVRAEAQSEPYLGKVAVAKVVLNRIDSGKFPSTLEGVIYQSGQFSPVTNGSINKPADTDSRRAASEAVSTNDTLGGSLFFYNPRTATSRWLDGLQTTVVIGNHTFKK